MRLTQEIDYAFRIIAHLASNEGKVIGAPKIARAMDVPERFTLRILRKLNLAGLTRSKRGANGGYILNKPAASITLYDIILAVDGPIELNRCLHADDPQCNRYEGKAIQGCKFHRTLYGIQEEVIQQFQNVPITNFIETVEAED
ncbi:Rrf2 family protein [Peptoniphilus ivorii]|uniref:RrF2 family transcriptional regulator n=1 Tax=Aedoeadaptatus ivorii TaxID=54006 RepID=UPI000F838AD2|nr:Rrf2 family transcriptional regulator [Peptoniphilus ivorii]MDQ0507569.1 Rrf2 family protein [Peptoniphilus ivorii]